MLLLCQGGRDLHVRGEAKAFLLPCETTGPQAAQDLGPVPRLRDRARRSREDCRPL